MFDVDLDDVQLGAQRKPVQWAVRAESATSRSALKQERVEARYGSAAAGSEPGAAGTAGRQKTSRATRALERRMRSERPSDRGTHKNEPRDPSISWLPQEIEEGNCEYKLRLRDPSSARLEQLITQMKFRMSEGNGECFYYVGVEDGGYPRGLSDNDLRLSLNNLHYMAGALKATATVARLFQGAHGRCCALVHVRDGGVEDVSYLEMRVAVGGSVGCGKSTLVAVLSHGAGGRPALDDGRGRARTTVLRHRHEIQSGHTSSISQCILGYNSRGVPLNYNAVSAPTAAEIGAAAAKVLHFIDLCGHSRFFKTALYGMTSLLPDCLMLCVHARDGVNRTTQEHLAAALALDIPVFAVITQADTVPPAALQATVLATRTLLATAAGTAAFARPSLAGHSTDDASDADLTPAAADARARGDFMFAIDDEQAAERRLERRVPLVATEAKAAAVAQLMGIIQQHHHPLQCRSYMVPCFVTSSTTGSGVMLLHRFLSGLQQAPRRKQPVDVRRRRHLLESFSGRLAPGVSEDHSWSLSPPAALSAAPPLPTVAAPASAVAPPAPVHHSAPGLHGGNDDAATHAEGRGDGVRIANGKQNGESLRAGDAAAVSRHQVAPVQQSSPAADMVHFQVDHVFEVQTVGTVLSGTTVRGCIELGTTLWWGPQDNTGDFAAVVVRGIHRSRVPVAKVVAGQCATIAVEQLPPPRERSASRGSPGQPRRESPRSMAASDVSDTAPSAAPRPGSPLIRTHSAGASPRPASGSGLVQHLSPATSPRGAVSSQLTADAARRAGAEVREGAAAEVGAEEVRRVAGAGAACSGGTGTASEGAGERSGLGDSIRLAPPSLGSSDAGTPAFGSPAQLRGTLIPGTQGAPAQAPDRPSQLSELMAGEGATQGASAPLPGTQGPPRSAALPGTSAPFHGQAPLSGEALRRLSESLSDTQMHISATPPDASGDASWHHVGLHLAGLTVDGDAAAAGRGRKGTVLLDQRMEPHATTEICALLILTNGQWPPRGLVSGRWPPGPSTGDHLGGHEDGLEAKEGSVLQRRGRAGERGDGGDGPEVGGSYRGRSRKPRYVHMVYCAATRQEAEVLAMREVHVDLERERYEVDGINLSAAAAAAAVLLGDKEQEDGGQDSVPDDRVGAVADVRLKFMQRAEFLVAGMRLIVRDHAGSVSAVGVVRAVL